MRWGSIIALLIVMALATGVAQDMPSTARAQDSTPAAEQELEGGAPEGVSLVTVASGSIEVLSPGTANLALGRIRLAPRATLPFDPTDGSVDLVYMTAGTLTFRVGAPMTVARGVAPGTPAPTEPEAIPADTEFTLSDGDSAVFPPSASGEVRNDGDEEATAWVANLALRGEEAGTPTP